MLEIIFPNVLLLLFSALSLCEASILIRIDSNELPQLENNIVITANIFNDTARDNQVVKNINEGFQGSLPPVIEESLTAKDCACNQLLLSSLGDAKQHYPQFMGVYKKYGVYNSKPSYFGPNSARLYFLPTGWIVGPSVGSPSGYMTNLNKSRSYCSYEIPDIWLFVYNGKWFNDTTLVLRCIA